MAAFWKRGHRNAVKYVALALAAVSVINFVSAKSMKKNSGVVLPHFLEIEGLHIFSAGFPARGLAESPRGKKWSRRRGSGIKSLGN